MRMKSGRTIVLALAASLLGVVGSAEAGTFNSTGTYSGTISGVAVNFWSGVGVGLTGGATCNGHTEVILLYTDPHCKDMLAVLMTAETTGKNVRMYALTGTIQTYYTNYAYCVITAVSLGDFSAW